LWLIQAQPVGSTQDQVCLRALTLLCGVPRLHLSQSFINVRVDTFAVRQALPVVDPDFCRRGEAQNLTAELRYKLRSLKGAIDDPR